MKKLISISTFFLCLCMTLPAQEKPHRFDYSESALHGLAVSEKRLAYIDRLLQDYVDRGIIPHALTFVAKDGVVIHNKAFGWNNIEQGKRLKKDDIFRNFSQTKAIASVALLTLFEQGKFQLDDPVSKYIPECTDQVLEKLNEDGTYTTRKVKRPLTIRHLLSHTSGIMGNNDLRKIRSEKFKRDKPYQTLAEEVKDLVSLPLAFDPGTQWNYHPASDVYGYLVEYFSGKSLRQYVKETILIPLGMKDTDWYLPESYRERMVVSYREVNGSLKAQENVWSGRNPFSADTTYAQAGTGLNGTIEDYARFCQMILNKGIFNGKRILGRRTVEMMMQDQLPHPNNGGNGFYFGLGFQIYPGDDKNTGRSAISNFTPMVSAGSLTWGGANNTDYIIDPQENMIILLYTNRTPDTKIWELFLNTVYQALE